MNPIDPGGRRLDGQTLVCSCRVAMPNIIRQSGNYLSESELLSEIHFANVLILQNFVRRACGNKAAITEYIGSTANSEGFPNIVVRDKHPNLAIT
jgi:hypothetical protein